MKRLPPPNPKRFERGNRASVGHGRPKKLPELRYIIAEVMTRTRNRKLLVEILFDRLEQLAMSKKHTVALRAIEMLITYAYARELREMQVQNINVNVMANVLEKNADVAALLQRYALPERMNNTEIVVQPEPVADELTHDATTPDDFDSSD